MSDCAAASPSIRREDRQHVALVDPATGALPSFGSARRASVVYESLACLWFSPSPTGERVYGIGDPGDGRRRVAELFQDGRAALGDREAVAGGVVAGLGEIPAGYQSNDRTQVVEGVVPRQECASLYPAG